MAPSKAEPTTFQILTPQNKVLDNYCTSQSQEEEKGSKVYMFSFFPWSSTPSLLAFIRGYLGFYFITNASHRDSNSKHLCMSSFRFTKLHCNLSVVPCIRPS